MNRIVLFLTGCIDIANFSHKLLTEKDLQDLVRSLIPPDAVNNRNHGIWRYISYEALNSYQFDLLSFVLCRHRFDGSIEDNLNIFGTFKAVCKYLHPNVTTTEAYNQAFDVYLSAVKNCYGGPEVDMLINNVVVSTLSLRTKKQRIQRAKDAISKLFLSESGKMPRWIQGAEWPMGERTPMVFVSQKKRGECVHYVFKDADTNQSRVIEQWY